MTGSLLSFTYPAGRAFINGFSASDFPFKNFILGRGSISAGTYAYPGNLNANGLPIAQPTTTIAGNFFWPSSYTGRWKVAFTGTGRFLIGFGGSANQITVHSGGLYVLGLTPTDSGTVSFNLIVDGTNPVVEFSYTGTQPTTPSFQFPNAGTYSGMDKLIVCRSTAPYTNDLADVQSEVVANCFNADFLSALSALHLRGYRPMDWSANNNSNVTRAAYLPQTGYNAFNERWVPGAWAGVTSGTDTYTASAATDTPGSFTDGEIAQVQFGNARTTMAITGAANNGAGLIRLQVASTATLSTNQWITVDSYSTSGGGNQGGGLWKITVIDATHLDLIQTFGAQPSVFGAAYSSGGTIGVATLDVGSRGAKPIVNSYGGATNGSAVPAITANVLATVVYDLTFDAWLFTAGGLNGGVSVEIQVALANKLGIDLWYNVPHLMNDAGVTTIVNYIKANLNSARTCWLEFSNEVWNFIFSQTLYLWNRAYALGIPNTNAEREYGGYALRMRQVMGLATTAWGGNTIPALKRIMGVQFFGSTTNNDTYRFKGGDLSSVGYNAAPNRPIDYSDVISYAPYYSGAVLRNFDASYTGGPPALVAADLTALTGAADNYASGVPASMVAALAWVDNDIRAGTSGVSATLGTNTLLSFTNTKYSGWETLATTYSKEVSCYEGGYEGLYPSTSTCTALGISTSYGGSSGSIATMIVAYKNDAMFKQLVLDQWANFMSSTHSAHPCWYTFGGSIQWSMLPGNLSTTPFKSYDAMTQFNYSR